MKTGDTIIYLTAFRRLLMTKAELIKENTRLRKALERIVDIDNDECFLKQIKDKDYQLFYPIQAGVMTAIAEIALEEV